MGRTLIHTPTQVKVRKNKKLQHGTHEGELGGGGSTISLQNKEKTRGGVKVCQARSKSQHLKTLRITRIDILSNKASVKSKG